MQYGYLPENDALRYFPEGFQTFREQQVLSYVIAGFYYFLKIFNPALPLMDATIWLPVPAFFISLIFFYLMVKELTNKKTALIATAFIAFIPSYIFRTLAGVTDKESIAMIFWFSMTWALLKSLKAKTGKKILEWGILSGVLGGLNALTWGGANFLFHSISLTFLLFTVMNKITRKQEVTFYSWYLITLIMNATLTLRYPGILTHDIFIMGTLTAIVIPLKELAYKFIISKIKNKKVPDSLYFIGILAAVSIIALPVMQITGVFDIAGKVNSAIETLKHPFGTCPFCVSVSENQEPYFIDTQRGVDWWHGLQWTLPLFMIGAVLLVQESLHKFGKDAIIMIVLFTVFMTFFMFSKFSSDQNFQTLNIFFSSTYLYTLPLLLIAMLLFYIKYCRRSSWNEVTPEKLILIFWFSLSVIATRGAIRVLFASTPVFMIIAAYCITRLKDLIYKFSKDKIYAYTLYVIAAIITLWAYSTTAASASSYYSSFTADWVSAMNWVQNNTDVNAVFTHWWDYGYWVQTMGNRTTTVDGGNYKVDWDEIIGGRTFSGYNMTEVYNSLIYFTDNKTGKRPNYFLIMDDDVLKYVQMANIGGRPGYYAPYSYSQRIENTFYQPETFSTVLVFKSLTGPGLVGEDVILNNELYPKEQTYILNVLIPMSEQQEFGQPLAAVYNAYTGKSVIAPYACVCQYNDECHDTNLTNSIPSCIEFIQGGVIHIPSNLKNRLMTHLYLLNQTIPGFEIAYSTPAGLSMQGILSQGDPTDITIYRINYTEMKLWVDNGSPAW